MAVSPTQNTLKKLRSEGYTAEVTERWNPFAKIRQDLFGVIDVLALGNGEVVGVQATSYSNISARVNKIKEHPNTEAIRKSGVKLVVQGWRKVKNKWVCREVDVFETISE